MQQNVLEATGLPAGIVTHDRSQVVLCKSSLVLWCDVAAVWHIETSASICKHYIRLRVSSLKTYVHSGPDFLNQTLSTSSCLAREVGVENVNMKFAPAKHWEPPEPHGVPGLLLQNLLFPSQIPTAVFRAFADPPLLAFASWLFTRWS